jgi:hypothetical protein
MRVSKNPADLVEEGVVCPLENCGKSLSFISSLQRHLCMVHKLSKEDAAARVHHV